MASDARPGPETSKLADHKLLAEGGYDLTSRVWGKMVRGKSGQSLTDRPAGRQPRCLPSFIPARYLNPAVCCAVAPPSIASCPRTALRLRAPLDLARCVYQLSSDKSCLPMATLEAAGSAS